MHIASARGLVRIAAVGAAAFALCLPAAINGGPIIYPDSDAYYSNGANIIGEVFGSEPEAIEPSPAPSAETSTTATAGPPMQVTTIAARSIYFGLLTYIFSFSQLWGLVALQSLIASIVLWRAARIFSGEDELALFAALSAVALFLTTLPWFTGFVMPDVWVSFPVLLLALVMFGPTAPTRLDLAGLFVLTAAAAAFHNASLLVLVGAIGLGAALAWWAGVGRNRLRAVSATVAAGVATALLAGVVLNVAAAHHYGERLRMPIFITARMLADGPGRDYLRERCAQDAGRYALCRFSALPLDNFDDVLWSDDPDKGVWTISDYDTRLALADEQMRFVLGVATSKPLAQFAVSSMHGIRSFLDVGLLEARWNVWEDWAGNSYWSTLGIHRALGQRSVRCLAAPERCGPSPIVPIAEIIVAAAFWLALALAIGRFAQTKPWTAARGERARLEFAGVGFVIAVLAFNALVCGALAGEYDRYQARIAWILPIYAFLVLAPWAAWIARMRAHAP